MFQDKTIGLANQVLNIALCECQGDFYGARDYFSKTSHFELVVRLED
jgi:hypothetical protein